MPPSGQAREECIRRDSPWCCRRSVRHGRTPDRSSQFAPLTVHNASYERCSVKMNEQMNDAELVRLGIERVQTEVYRWGGYRYTNLSDAVAAAKRAQR